MMNTNGHAYSLTYLHGAETFTEKKLYKHIFYLPLVKTDSALSLRVKFLSRLR